MTAPATNALFPASFPAQMLKVTLISGILFWLVWQIVVYGMANHATQEQQIPEEAVGWLDSHARANLELGLRDYQRNPEAAMLRLQAAIAANPADGRGYAALAVIHESRGAREKADQLMETAAKTSPQRSDVQLQAGAYWTRRGDYVRALDHLDTVLRHRPELYASLFPELLKIVENPANQPALLALLKQPVPWWSAFFIHASRMADTAETAGRLYSLRGRNPLPVEAVRAYLERLQKDGRWTDAWFVWINSLSREEVAQSGHVYNGSFERPFTNLGFDWVSQPDAAVIMENAATYGTTGERALHLLFRGLRSHFRHLHQYLLLPPGKYYLQGRVRPERLEAAQGMQWVLYCEGKNEPLVTTDKFRGSDQWTRFRSEFTVGNDCTVQKLQLELAGKIQLDFDVAGGIWFDDLAIEQYKRAGQE